MGKGTTSPIIHHLRDPVSLNPLWMAVYPCIGHWGIALEPIILKVEGYNLIPIHTKSKGRTLSTRYKPQHYIGADPPHQAFLVHSLLV